MASSLGTLLASMEHRLNSCIVPTTSSILQAETLNKDVDAIEPPPEQACYEQRKCETYHVIYHESMKTFAENLKRNKTAEQQFILHNTDWGKFPDGTDNITLGATGNYKDGVALSSITSPTYFKGKDLLFVASFHNNETTMSQFHVLAHLCESFAKSLTVLLPYYSTSTMERVDIRKDGVVPSANTLARLFNGLPSMGYPIRLMTYDLHTLQNRFYVTGHAVASLHTAIPLMIEEITSQPAETRIDRIAFPDAGAHKRFAELFTPEISSEAIICGKVRVGSERKVRVLDGMDQLKDAKHVLIVDDQTKSGGTLAQCARELKRIALSNGNGSILVSAFVTHVIFDNEFLTRNGGGLFTDLDNFYTTDSIPNIITTVPSGNSLKITVPRDNSTHSFTKQANVKTFNLAPQVIKDL